MNLAKNRLQGTGNSIRLEREGGGGKKRRTSEWNIIDSIIAPVRILPGSGLAPQGNPPSVRNASTTNVTFDFTISESGPTSQRRSTPSRLARVGEKRKREKKEERNNLLIFLLL